MTPVDLSPDSDLQGVSTIATPRVLYVDIETSPNLADVWGLWDQNVGLSQLRQSSRIIGFGAKWRGQKSVRWQGEYDPDTGDLTRQRQMLEAAHALYDEADVIVTYNGDKFDNKHFNGEWVSAGLTPPSPSLSLDLFKVVRQNFKFPSNKLQYVSERLLGVGKVKHQGHGLWRECLDDDVDPDVRRRAWSTMARYCRRDVALLEPLHDRLEPWLPKGINFALLAGPSDALGCQKCGSEDLESRGTAYTATRAYPQYRCRDCGGWTRDPRSSWSLARPGRGS